MRLNLFTIINFMIYYSKNISYLRNERRNPQEREGALKWKRTRIKQMKIKKYIC